MYWERGWRNSPLVYSLISNHELSGLTNAPHPKPLLKPIILVLGNHYFIVEIGVLLQKLSQQVFHFIWGKPKVYKYKLSMICFLYHWKPWNSSPPDPQTLKYKLSDWSRSWGFGMGIQQDLNTVAQRKISHLWKCHKETPCIAILNKNKKHHFFYKNKEQEGWTVPVWGVGTSKRRGRCGEKV
jgi:hypothetical protein